MPMYLTRFSYTPQTWARLIKNPEDRRDAARQYIEAVGGKLHGFWYAFGEYDAYNLWEAPDNVSMAATALAISAGGALSSPPNSTPRMSPPRLITCGMPLPSPLKPARAHSGSASVLTSGRHGRAADGGPADPAADGGAADGADAVDVAAGRPAVQPDASRTRARPARPADMP